jgi:phospho-N-acetylmuramoyl-pentapeptide-transferase
LLVSIFPGISSRVIFALVTAFMAALVFTPWITGHLRSRQFGQVVREEGVETHLKKAGTPTMGGLVMLVAIIVSALFWARLSWQVLSSLAVLVILGGVGFADDFLKVTRQNTDGVSSRGKLFFQATASLAFGAYLLFVQGTDPLLFVPVWGQQVNLGVLYIPFIMLVVVGASNAVNLTDGLDGLAAGILAIVAAGLAAVSYVSGNAIFSSHLAIPFVRGAGELAVVLAAMVGSCIGFLWYNTNPAEVFMGDTGSLAMGGLLGCVAVLTRQELMLALIGGIFVVEALSVMIQVGYYKRTKKRVFLMAPIHHHFEKLGWAEPKVVIRFWILTLVLTLLGFAVLGFHSILHRVEDDPRLLLPRAGAVLRGAPVVPGRPASTP